jgi:hypothetical protein
MGKYMKKFIPIVLVSILVLSGLGAAAFTTNVSLKQASPNAQSISASVSFASQPTFEQKDGFINVEINGATTQLLNQNKPVLPVYVKTYEIPYGSTNIQVTATPKNIDTMTISQQIAPARIAPISKMSQRTTYVKDQSIYGSAALYPNSWSTLNLGAGRNDNNVEVIFVKVVCYPVRYSPMNNEITYAGSFDISISFDAPKTQPKTVDAFDMVVIAPAKFQTQLQPLIDEKIAKGVATTFKSVEDILTEYTGFDQPEQVKYFIKYAYDTWGITYVLLVGGLKSEILSHDKDTRSAGYTDWWVPVRYVSMPQEDDEACLSDLYYGCLYNATGFDSWDSNGDGVYGAWDAPHAANDIVDLYPEVYVARLPCSTAREVTTVVNKIITYESTGADAKSWYNNFIGIGGKTFDYFDGQPDGEYLCSLAYSYIHNLNPNANLVSVYSTNRNTSGYVPDKSGIEKAITQGAGFVDFEGHGFPLGWNTIWFDGSYDNGDWVGGILLYNFLQINNKAKLPVVVVGGCHNALYNVSVIPGMKDKAGTNYFVFGYPVPVCFSWGLVVKPRGGAIASTGCTGYGMGYQGNPVTLSAELESNFFWQIGMNGATHLAQAHSKAIQKFVTEEPIDQLAAFCVTNWALLGDPSLQFGGYSS